MDKSLKKTGKIVPITGKTPNDALYIVAVGASADGLETLKLLFSHAFLNGNIAFVVITHQSPTHVSILPELLQSFTSLKVTPILKQQPVEANHIYVLPPGQNLILQNDVLKLIPVENNSENRFPIDYFLRSLAKDPPFTKLDILSCRNLLIYLIETSKEELQSLNEELTTVNAELESRIEQLSSANDDIKNLPDNTEIATVFLDKELCIKRFTPKATEIINLIASDVSRPISHIVSYLRYDNLIADSRMVLATLEPKTTEVMDRNRHWYVVRIIPYRTVANVIDGVVITFLNIHSQKKAEIDAVCLKDHFDSAITMSQFLLNSIKKPALLLNEKEKIIFANQASTKYLKMSETDLIQTSINKTKLGLDRSYIKSLVDSIAGIECLNALEFKNPLSGLESFDLHKYSNSLILLLLNLKK